MSQDYFCSQCGNKLEPTMQFCPKCGTVIAGSAAEEQMIADQQEAYMQYQESRMYFVSFLIAIYAIPAIFIGLFTLFNADVFASSVFTHPDFVNWLVNHPEYDITLGDVETYFYTFGGLCTGSGVAGIVSLVTICLRRFWVLSTVACFISTLLCIWSIFGLVIGFFVSMMILSAKDFFYKDYAVKLGE